MNKKSILYTLFEMKTGFSSDTDTYMNFRAPTTKGVILSHGQQDLNWQGKITNELKSLFWTYLEEKAINMFFNPIKGGIHEKLTNSLIGRANNNMDYINSRDGSIFTDAPRITENPYMYSKGSAYDQEKIKNEAINNRKIIEKIKIANATDAKNIKKASSVELGKLYFFSYLPENRNTMDHYDRFPLILLLKKKQNGFLALNFHYLRENKRSLFWGRLLEYVKMSNIATIRNSKISVGYELLKHPKFAKFYKPCLKFYKYNSIKSSIAEIHPSNWSTMMFFPLDKFVKQNRLDVWKQIDEKIQESN